MLASFFKKMTIIKFKEKLGISRTDFVDLEDFLREVGFLRSETNRTDLDFRELREDEITPEIALKAEETRRKSKDEFINI